MTDSKDNSLLVKILFIVIGIMAVIILLLLGYKISKFNIGPVVLESPATSTAASATSPSSIIENPFTGSWQGIDPYDGSTTTISLVQTGSQLVGTYNDSFTLNVEPPGYHGKGSGSILSATTAQIIFDLSRWDGRTYKYDFHLTFSNQNNTLLMDDCFLNGEVDTLGCPMVLQRK